MKRLACLLRWHQWTHDRIGEADRCSRCPASRPHLVYLNLPPLPPGATGWKIP